MGSKPLTKREQAWLTRLQKCLDACPSKRMGFYTVGDPNIVAYDSSLDTEIHEIHDAGGEFCNAVDKAEAGFQTLEFPGQVHSTAG